MGVVSVDGGRTIRGVGAGRGVWGSGLGVGGGPSNSPRVSRASHMERGWGIGGSGAFAGEGFAVKGLD
jgi:hypothetical protein